MTLGFRAPLFLLLLVSLQRTGEEGPALLMGSSQAFCGFSFLADGTPRGRSCSSTSPQFSVRISLFFLSFSIQNLQFDSSLEDPSTSYYQGLQRNISELTVCQCRRKNCGQLDIFPTRNAYHPMSEYPTYHTHGRYVPPGSGRRSPYEEVSAGNGGSGLSYVNPNPSATSANL
uniref:Mucin 1, cell surface associated n=1 Tax=Ursus maritimus TaxID=29073 RepID=A0A452V0J4_URSMA